MKDARIHAALRRLRKFQSNGLEAYNTILDILTVLLWDLPKSSLSKCRSHIVETSRKTLSYCKRRLQHEDIFVYNVIGGECCFVTNCEVCKPPPAYRQSDSIQHKHQGRPILTPNQDESELPEYCDKLQPPPYFS